MYTTHKLILCFILILVLHSPIFAIGPCTQYLDPNWAGAHVGTAAQPWSILDSGTWAAINTLLLTQDVYLCIASRLAGADTDSIYGSPSEIDFNNKTDTSGHRLTLEGISYYNVSEVTPAWTTSGRTRCPKTGGACSQVNDFISQNSPSDNVQGTLRSDISFIGFRVVTSTSSKGYSMCGSNLEVLRNSFSQIGVGVDPQPMIQIVPTADAPHEGSHAPCPRMTNILIAENYLNHPYAEFIYVGGGGCSIGGDDPLAGATCIGFPAHDQITIRDNEIDGAVITGTGQTDGIDVKGGMSNVLITRNTIININNNSEARAIVMQGKKAGDPCPNNFVTYNFINNNRADSDGQVTIANTWGTPDCTYVFGNIISNGISAGHGSEAGIVVYNCTACSFFANVIYKMIGVGMRLDAGGNTVKNNALVGNNGGGAQVDLSGSYTSSNNAYGGSWSGTCTSCISGLVDTASIDFVNAPTGNFHVASITSKLYLNGADLTSLSLTRLTSDYDGVARPNGSAWSIGPFEYVSTPTHFILGFHTAILLALLLHSIGYLPKQHIQIDKPVMELMRILK